MLRILTDLELSKISGGAHRCAACKKKIEEGEDIALITPIYNVFFVNENPNTMLSTGPGTCYDKNSTAITCYKSCCIRRFIKSRPKSFSRGHFYFYINPSKTFDAIQVR